MRIPKNIKPISDSSITEESIHFDDYEKISIPHIEKVNDTTIKKIEKVVRASIEMREYILFLKQELNLSHCSFFTNLDYEDVSIEIHHGPLTLYDVTDIVLRKQMTENINITIWDVAEEITKLHYENRIGLIPLSVTIHQLLHQSELFIPYQLFYGDFKSFYREYKAYFTNDQINMLKNYIKMSNEVIKDMSIPDILQRNYKYLEVNGMELPYRIELDKKKKKID